MHVPLWWHERLVARLTVLGRRVDHLDASARRIERATPRGPSAHAALRAWRHSVRTCRVARDHADERAFASATISSVSAWCACLGPRTLTGLETGRVLRESISADGSAS